jgi:hypothetical protein
MRFWFYWETEMVLCMCKAIDWEADLWLAIFSIGRATYDQYL